MSGIEHCMSGVAEHHEARRKEKAMQRRAKEQKHAEKLFQEQERRRQMEEALRQEKTRRQTSEETDRERRAGDTVYPDSRWNTAKIPNRFSSRDYMSQW